jgi:glyceraldehyde 3-phosphate dehydrogenase
MTRNALNGLGRIGKLALRDLIDTGAGGEIVLLNDPVGDAEQHALLMEFDSVHGRWKTAVSYDDNGLILNGQPIRLTHDRTIEALPLAELGVDLVIDCTGVFKTGAKVAPYYAAGVKKVVVSAPVKAGGALNLVYGVNHHLYDGSQSLITAASCTTNCLAPMAKVLDDAFGIEIGYITTIHAYTQDQSLQDAPHSDLRRARAAALNIVPTSTGAAKAVGLVLPHLQGKLDGVAMRVPVADGSLTDLTVVLKKPATKAEINAAMEAAANGPMKGILEYSTEPLVSTDIIGNPHSCVFDSEQTMAHGTFVKVVGWYDNEFGYSSRAADLIALVGAGLLA